MKRLGMTTRACLGMASHFRLEVAFQLYSFQWDDHPLKIGNAAHGGQIQVPADTRKYMHAETLARLALLTKPLYFPNMKYLEQLSW
jgi:hypothetical protein